MLTIEYDIKTQMIHIPKKIMHELYEIDVNPRYPTLLLFLTNNYPQYSDDDNAWFIWKHAHDTQTQLFDAIF